MTKLSLIIAPDPIFSQRAQAVAHVNDEIRRYISEMFEVLYQEQGVGLGANMVGLLKRIIVIDLQEGGIKTPLAMINPEITSASDEVEIRDEASLSFPGIHGAVSRPRSIEVRYLDEQGTPQSLHADGWLATVIQHERDYLDGVTFLDHLSKMKRTMLMKKMLKQLKES
ncbi:MAG: peptide deformylase [Parvibaculaceae bacterium]|jgi:peptide deformylase|nr:peptide deformylase [Parvibaculaceae bacterium]|tara:strand:+ start:456 stop:962 length:507 start_codon:yes stop_codon:yes gene_type:complete